MRIENETVHYRTRFTLVSEDSSTRAITAALRSIYGWLLEKEERRRSSLLDCLKGVDNQKSFLTGDLSFPVGYSGGYDPQARVAACVKAIRQPSRGTADAWALELDEPDFGQSFRRWHSRIGLAQTRDGSCIVNVRVSHYVVPGYFGEIPSAPAPAVPRFVRAMFELEGYRCLVGTTAIEPDAVRLTTLNFKDSFERSLTDPGRDLPLVLITSRRDGRWPLSNPLKAAKSLTGMASVYLLDWNVIPSRECLVEIFPKEDPAWAYRCQDGMVRIYPPEIDLSDASAAVSSRYFLGSQIEERYEADEPFVEMLARSFTRSYIKGDEDVLDIGDIDLRRTRLAIAASREKISELRGRVHGEVTADAGVVDAADRVEELQQLLDLYEEDNESQAMQISILEERLTAAQAAADMAESMRFRLGEAYRRAEEEVERTEALTAELSYFHSLDHFPRTLSEELKLAAGLWADKVAVLDEAYASADEFQHADLDEEWAILKSIALDLWPLYFESENVDVERDYREKTGFELSCRDCKTTRRHPEAISERRRLYNGREIDITPHIKGTGKVPAHPFRLHFYVDRDESKIVVGHCGGHLTTAGSRRRA